MEASVAFLEMDASLVSLTVIVGNSVMKFEVTVLPARALVGEAVGMSVGEPVVGVPVMVKVGTPVGL